MFSFDVEDDKKRIFLDLGKVGQNASLTLNGKPLGIRISPPYLFEITEAAVPGKNQAEVIVSNTLAQKMRGEYYSQFIPLAPSGLLGDMRLITIEKGCV